MANSSDTRFLASVIREEDLEALEDLRRELQQRCDQAHADARIYMMGQYIRLIATISPEIDRVQRRFKREALAASRKMHKDLKADHRAPSPNP